MVDSQVLIHQSKQGEYPTPQSTHTKKREKLIANKNEVLLHIKIDIRFTTYIYTYLHLYIAFENDLFDLMGGIWFLFFWRLCLLCSWMFPLEHTLIINKRDIKRERKGLQVTYDIKKSMVDMTWCWAAFLMLLSYFNSSLTIHSEVHAMTYESWFLLVLCWMIVYFVCVGDITMLFLYILSFSFFIQYCAIIIQSV